MSNSDEPRQATPIRLTQYSHGAGCGCKIEPKILEEILSATRIEGAADPALLVGNQSKDDAAAYDIGGDQVVLSTTDFFMPIADDPFDFGRIAATNAISDIYAMGGRPLMAIAILGWPIKVLSAEVAKGVIEGGRAVCRDAGIPLAGGHSIDSPEPIFGLAVTGMVEKDRLKRNDTAEAGCSLYLTKPLGVGIFTTSQKRGVLKPEDLRCVIDTMCQLNNVGPLLAEIPGVTAITDVTGFGLMGHLLEMCQGSGVSAKVRAKSVPKLPNVDYYLAQGCLPGGTGRNFGSYGQHLGPMTEEHRSLFCDPQTSGGLLVAVRAESCREVEELLQSRGLVSQSIGELVERKEEGETWITVES